MILSLSGALGLGCRDAGPEPTASEPSTSVWTPPQPSASEPSAPTPTPIAPVPTLTAVFVGDVASRLLASGAAIPAPNAPAAAPASPPTDPPLAAAPAPSSASGPASDSTDVVAAAPASPPTRAWVAAQPVPRAPYERPDDETWVLPDAPAELIWRHPAPAAGLQVEIIEAKGRSWPTRVRIEPADGLRVATVTPLDPLPAGTDFRLVARVLAADGASLLWTEPLRVRRPEPPPPPETSP